MTQIEALKQYLDGTISTMDYNIKQHERNPGSMWGWPGTYEGAKIRLAAFREIRDLLG